MTRMSSRSAKQVTKIKNFLQIKKSYYFCTSKTECTKKYFLLIINKNNIFYTLTLTSTLTSDTELSSPPPPSLINNLKVNVKIKKHNL